jgi:aminobenzoyl-glutamate utilization protein B
LIEGAPGHGEGHNSGVPLNILAAIAVKRQMEKNKLPGTIKVWPGVAEELVAGKAYFVRDGYFKDVDVVLFTHVGNNLSVTAGPASATAGSGNTTSKARARTAGRRGADAVL